MKSPIVLFFSLCLALGLADVAASQTVAPEAAAIQKVIEAQWTAFATRDGERALSFAAPQVRGQFATPEAFLSMVENGYPMVFQHFSSRFLETRVGFRQSWQVVRLVDLQGDVWYLLYQLYRQASGEWLIGGVFALPSADTPDLVPPPLQA